MFGSNGVAPGSGFGLSIRRCGGQLPLLAAQGAGKGEQEGRAGQAGEQITHCLGELQTGQPPEVGQEEDQGQIIDALPAGGQEGAQGGTCLLYTSPSPRD